MNASTEISKFEANLETSIKGAFEKILRNGGDFEIAADYNTHHEIDDLVKGLGLSVYGMSVTPDEFTITFEFTGLYDTMKSLHRPKYCRIRLENSGEYAFSLTENDLNKKWWCGITDVFFNVKLFDEAEVLETMTEMNQVLMLIKLSN
jgi:hypothetical protein